MPPKRSGIIFIDKPPILTDSQLSVVSEILRNIGLLIFGSVIIPYFFENVDKPSISVVLLSLLFVIALFSFSITIVRSVKNI